jgi:hypothetical protein
MPRTMSWKQRIGGGVLGLIGFMLSPLSWWNDAFVNLPLALAFAWGISACSSAAWRERVFQISLVAGYWFTNVLGFVLMHKGARWLRSPEEKAETRRELLKDFWISLAYTGLIVVLVRLGVLKPIESYFPGA